MAHTDHPAHDYEAAVTDGAQLVDVREPEEVETGTLPGALSIPLGSLPDRLGELDPKRRVVLLCRSGNRSTMAAEFLTSQGFSDVVNLDGGMLAFDR